nr:hypothetical protein [uncultured Kingella sp.]
MQNSLYTIGTPTPLSPDQTQTWQLPSDCAHPSSAALRRQDNIVFHVKSIA